MAECLTLKKKKVKENKMKNNSLDLNFIKTHTLWIAKYFDGHRDEIPADKVDKYTNNPDVKDVDTLCWEQQPESVRDFWRAYEYANYQMQRHDLFLVDDFYKEYIKDPKQFEPKKKGIACKLSSLMQALPDYFNLIITNYDGKVAGNHRVGNFKEALEYIEAYTDNPDFDVIEFTKTSADTYSAIVQTDDLEIFKRFTFAGNKIAISHDKFMGDGKYYPPEERDR